MFFGIDFGKMSHARVARVGVVHAHGLLVYVGARARVACVCWRMRTGFPMLMPPGLAGAPGVDSFLLLYHCAVLCWLWVDLRLAMTFHLIALRCTAFLALPQQHQY